MEEIHRGYRSLDRSSQTFDYPARLPERREQVVFIPNSFAHLALDNAVTSLTVKPTKYDIYGNAFCPCERILLESFVKAAVDDEGIDSESYWITPWSGLLRSWISMMVGYLGINNEVIDDPDDPRAVTWHSRYFGRTYE